MASTRLSEPLLPPKLMNEQRQQQQQQQVEPLSSTTSGSIKALSVIRIALGAACLVAPRWTCALFQFPVPAAYAILPRMFGVRDLALGELLLTAEDKNSPSGGRREIKRALWANIGCDCVDVASILLGVATGSLSKAPAFLLGGGAVAFVGLEVLGMRGL